MSAFVIVFLAVLCCQNLCAVPQNGKAESYEDGEGGYVTFHRDGTKTRTTFDGYCYTTYYPDGSKKVFYPDGMGGFATYGPNGTVSHSYDNGYGFDTYNEDGTVSHSYDDGEGFATFE